MSALNDAALSHRKDCTLHRLLNPAQNIAGRQNVVPDESCPQNKKRICVATAPGFSIDKQTLKYLMSQTASDGRVGFRTVPDTPTKTQSKLGVLESVMLRTDALRTTTRQNLMLNATNMSRVSRWLCAKLKTYIREFLTGGIACRTWTRPAFQASLVQKGEFSRVLKPATVEYAYREAASRTITSRRYFLCRLLGANLRQYSLLRIRTLWKTCSSRSRWPKKTWVHLCKGCARRTGCCATSCFSRPMKAVLRSDA